MSMLLLLGSVVSLPTQTGLAHEGPDPIADWNFAPSSEEASLLEARRGPAAQLQGTYRWLEDDAGRALEFGGRDAIAIMATDHNMVADSLPTESFTIAAWVSIDEPREWGGLLGVIQDNGDAEAGWVLGYDDRHFYLGLATTGADDGNGHMTYLRGESNYALGKYHFVVATYDGRTMSLYVDGKLDASSEEQSGAILYPRTAPFVMGAYRDFNEFHAHQGRIRRMTLYNQVASAEWVAQEFAHDAAIAALPRYLTDPEFEIVVGPYLQNGRTDAMTIMWQTTREASSTIHWGTTAECEQHLPLERSAYVHEGTIGDLTPATQYFYRVESTDSEGTVLRSDVWTFRTAPDDDQPVAFAVLSDTQGNPQVSGKLAEFIWGHRPDFMIHSGDLVDNGENDRHWTEHFFPSLQPLIGRVPFYPVLGNHERNAPNYFEYMSLPAPEYYYTFKQGNAQFFMLDSNRDLDSESEQFRWLETQLAESNATWKFVCHHHPPYSSDENDYGNLWQGNRSTWGDLRARQLVPLYEKYGVDIVWNGHIHSYERTWPIREGRAVTSDAPRYLITGGGGGSLEQAGPTRPFFQNHVRRGHHVVLVAINGTHLEFKAYDLEGRLFDTFTIEKSR
ncbi:MAG: metallophosphoesterase [Planctomycetales bacterium]|nr:metallophosphoesterase [Planctomycetales bacterium]